MLMLRNADYVLTLDERRRVLRHASVVVEGARIIDIGGVREIDSRYAGRLGDDDILDATATLLAPGFVNSHAHTMEHLSRGLIPDALSTLPWVLEYFFPFQAALTEEEAYVSASLCCLDMLQHGTTCFIDASILNANSYVDAVVQAIDDVGLRAIVGRGVCDRIPANLPPAFRATWCAATGAGSEAGALADVEALLKNWQAPTSGRVSAWATAFGLFSLCSDDLFVGVKRLADEYGTGTNFHIASSIEEASELEARAGVWPVTRLHELGVLGENVLLTHAVMVKEHEVALLAETDTRVAHCPGAALRLAKGIVHHGRIPEMLTQGVTVSIGADGVCSCGTFDHTRLTSLVAGLFKDARMDATLVPAETALEMATINGARALLLDTEIGSLSVGKRADIIQFDLNRPEWTPNHHPVRTLVYSAEGAGVKNVLVDGELMLRDGLPTRVDRDDLLTRARASADAAAQRTGLSSRPAWPEQNFLA